MPSSAIPFCIAALEGRSANGDLKGFLNAGALNIHKNFAMAELAELSLDDFKMVKAIYLAKKLGEDTSMFEQSVEHLGDLPEQVARAGLIIDSRGISDDEARAYVHDMLLEMKATDMVPNDAYTTRRSPAAEYSPMNSDAEISLLPGGSDTTSVKNGSDVSVADGMEILNIKEEQQDINGDLPDFDNEADQHPNPPTPINVILARAAMADKEVLQPKNAYLLRRAQDPVALEGPLPKRARLEEQPDEELEAPKDRC